MAKKTVAKAEIVKKEKPAAKKVANPKVKAITKS